MLTHLAPVLRLLSFSTQTVNLSTVAEAAHPALLELFVISILLTASQCVVLIVPRKASQKELGLLGLQAVDMGSEPDWTAFVSIGVEFNNSMVMSAGINNLTSTMTMDAESNARQKP